MSEDCTPTHQRYPHTTSIVPTLRVPSRRPLVLPSALWTTVNKQNDGVLFLHPLLEPNWLEDPTLNLLLRTIEVKFFCVCEGFTPQGVGGELRQLLNLDALKVALAKTLLEPAYNENVVRRGGA